MSLQDMCHTWVFFWGRWIFWTHWKKYICLHLPTPLCTIKFISTTLLKEKICPQTMLLSGTWRGGRMARCITLSTDCFAIIYLSLKHLAVFNEESSQHHTRQGRSVPLQQQFFLWCIFFVKYCYICSEVRFQSQKIACLSLTSTICCKCVSVYTLWL